MLIPILSLALAAPAPEPPAEAPKGPAPRVMVLNADKDGRAYLEGTGMVTKYVPQVQTVTRLVGGQQVVQQVTVQVPVTTVEQKRLFLDEEGVTVYDADGKKVEAKNLPKMNGPTPALVSTDGKEVDPFYLPLARKGTLIVVAPALGAGETGGALGAPRPGATTPPLKP